MGILDGDVAAIFGTAFGGMYLDGTHHAGTRQPIYSGGIITGYTGGDTPIKVQTDQVASSEKAADGYQAGDCTLIVLHVDGLTITVDSQVTDGYGDRYRVSDVDRDAARSHWILRGSPI